ncbi:hypothetical protein ACO1O0_005116 [Amphichorda felina]
MAQMEELPPEILSMILSYLDTDPPFPQLVHDYPELIVTHYGFPIGPHVDSSLLEASAVSHRWRQICLPMLLRHMKWNLQARSSYNDQGEPDQGLLNFLRDQDSDCISAIVEGLTVIALENPWPCDVFKPPDNLLERTKKTWSSIFSIIDPRRVTFIGDPSVIAILIGLGPLPGAAWWMFDLSKQVLQLSRSSRLQPQPLPSKSPSGPDIFSLRPWTEFLLNEGSFLENYTTYEYHENFPPCFLEKIFGAYPDPPPLPHLEKFSYISIFPTGAHIKHAVIPFIPGVPTLYMQMAPRFLDFSRMLGKSQMGHLDLNDPWMEGHDAAVAIRLALFDKDHRLADTWKHVRRFETDGEHSRTLFDTVREGIVDGSISDVNYREWRVLEDSIHGDILVRSHRHQ